MIKVRDEYEHLDDLQLAIGEGKAVVLIDDELQAVAKAVRDRCTAMCHKPDKGPTRHAMMCEEAFKALDMMTHEEYQAIGLHKEDTHE